MPKGDGLVTFLKEPSVELAIQLLDGTAFRYGMKVEWGFVLARMHAGNPTIEMSHLTTVLPHTRNTTLL